MSGCSKGARTARNTCRPRGRPRGRRQLALQQLLERPNVNLWTRDPRARARRHNRKSGLAPLRQYAAARAQLLHVLSAHRSSRCTLCTCNAVDKAHGFSVCSYHRKHGEDDPACPVCTKPDRELLRARRAARRPGDRWRRWRCRRRWRFQSLRLVVGELGLLTADPHGCPRGQVNIDAAEVRGSTVAPSTRRPTCRRNRGL